MICFERGVWACLWGGICVGHEMDLDMDDVYEMDIFRYRSDIE